MVCWLSIALVAGALLFIRIAPDDPLRWNVDPSAFKVWEGDTSIEPEIRQTPQGAIARWPGMRDAARVLGHLDDIALARPRTNLLAGSPKQGRMTWVTRTRLLGFPDYTTAQIGSDGVLYLWARQRYGNGDQGVNIERLGAWLKELDQFL